MHHWLFGFLALATLAGQYPWQEFTDYEGRFRVLVPQAMEKKENPIETAVGTLTYHSFYYQPTEQDPDNLLYLLSYCDYPEGAMHSDSTALLEAFFETTVRGSLASVKGELLYANDIEEQGFPGKLWRLVYQDGELSIKTKALMVGHRFYLVQAVGARAKGLSPAVDRYLDSFRLTTAPLDSVEE